jgi:RloB-like protein
MNRRLKRKIETRTVLNNFLLVCEGSKTEPNYFEKFRVPKTVIRGTGKNTLSLVKYTISEVEKESKSGISYDQVWCIFDRDSFPIAQVNAAFELAQRHNIRIAYSNESFELWYCLHFHLLATGIGRNDYIKKLNSSLNTPYDKASDEMYAILLPHQSKAIKHALHLHKHCTKRKIQYNTNYTLIQTPKAEEQIDIKTHTPYTSVFQLVEELNKSKLK